MGSAVLRANTTSLITDSVSGGLLLVNRAAHESKHFPPSTRLAIADAPFPNNDEPCVTCTSRRSLQRSLPCQLSPATASSRALGASFSMERKGNVNLLLRGRVGLHVLTTDGLARNRVPTNARLRTVSTTRIRTAPAGHAYAMYDNNCRIGDTS